MEYRPTYKKDSDGRRIDGVLLPILVHNRDYFLVDLEVYQDGEILYWGQLRDLQTLADELASGVLTTHVPPGGHVCVHRTIAFNVAETVGEISPTDVLKEVFDALRFLRGEETTLERFNRALAIYEESRTPEHLAELGDAFAAVPEHRQSSLRKPKGMRRPDGTGFF